MTKLQKSSGYKLYYPDPGYMYIYTPQTKVHV